MSNNEFRLRLMAMGISFGMLFAYLDAEISDYNKKALPSSKNYYIEFNDKEYKVKENMNNEIIDIYELESAYNFSNGSKGYYFKKLDNEEYNILKEQLEMTSKKTLKLN